MKILQIIDSLDAGGAERMAVQIANELHAAGHESHLCATRKEGLLKSTINEEVGYIYIEKKGKLGIKAMTKLKTYVVKNKIEIIHAHSTSFFTASIIKWWLPSIKLVWHDHYGNAEQVEHRNANILKKCSRFFNGIISVNELLQQWAQTHLRQAPTIYLRNFVSIKREQELDIALPGLDEKRMVHLANLRPQKDHLNLLKAFKAIVEKHPDWTLLLVGMDFKDEYSENIIIEIQKLSLEENVHLLGSRNDTAAILNSCSIGVLSSKSEGLPVALLEYGIAGLPVAVTDVGACKEVVSDFGWVMPSQNAEELAHALLEIIEDQDRAKLQAMAFQKHVMTTFGAQSYIEKLLQFYSAL